MTLVRSLIERLQSWIARYKVDPPPLSGERDQRAAPVNSRNRTERRNDRRLKAQIVGRLGPA
jgi:hypothetical protein